MSDQTLVQGKIRSTTAPTAKTNDAITDVRVDRYGHLMVRDAGVVSSGRGQAAAVVFASSYSDVDSAAQLKGSAPFDHNGSTWDPAFKASAVGQLPSSAATTNATVVKASVGDVFTINAYNTTAAVIYLKLYNKATAPTVGTDTPLLTLAIPPNGALAWAPCRPLYCSAGIGFALTTGAAAADTAAVGAGAVTGLNVAYA